MAYVRAMRRKKRKTAGPGPGSKSVTRTPSPKLNESGTDGLSGADGLLDGSAYRGHVSELEKLS